jgi:hypothetical protein
MLYPAAKKYTCHGKVSMPPQNRFIPSFAERNRQSRVARGLEEEHPVFESYRTPVRRDTITSHALDTLGHTGTVAWRMRSEPGSTANINTIRWYTRDEITVPDNFFNEYVQRWEVPVPEESPLTQKQKNQIERIEVYKRLARPVDFWMPKEGPAKYVSHMDTSHIASTLRVIWNHTRTPPIQPVRTYNFDRRVFTPWYVTQVTMALLTELKERVPKPTPGAVWDVLKNADWADRGFITAKGLLGEQDVPTKPHTP